MIFPLEIHDFPRTSAPPSEASLGEGESGATGASFRAPKPPAATENVGLRHGSKGSKFDLRDLSLI